jgi:hypothetical protein
MMFQDRRVKYLTIRTALQQHIVVFFFLYFRFLHFDFIQKDRSVLRVPGYRSRGPGFDSRRYQIFWEVVGLERGPLSLVSTIEELLGRKSSGSGLEIQEYGHRDPLLLPRSTLYVQKLALTSPTSGIRSVGIVHLRTKATQFFLISDSIKGRELLDQLNDCSAFQDNLSSMELIKEYLNILESNLIYLLNG